MVSASNGSDNRSNNNEYKPFPVHVLPEPLCGFVKAVSDSVDCDTSFAALPLLATLGGCVGGTRRVSFKKDYTQPPVIWAVSVAESAQGKSPAQSQVLRSFRLLESESREAGRQRKEQYLLDMKAYDSDLKAWIKGDRTESPPLKPVHPALGIMSTSDCTREGIAKVLEHDQRGILIAADELSSWVGGFGLYTSGRGGATADQAFWCKAYDDTEAHVTRASRDEVTVPHTAASVTGNITPGLFYSLVASPDNLDNGFCARMLIASPPYHSPDSDSGCEVPLSLHLEIGETYARLLALEYRDGAPVLLPLEEAAHEAFHETKQKLRGMAMEKRGFIGNVASKQQNTCLRLALLFALVRGDECVLQGDVERASEISLWAVNEWERVLAARPGDEKEDPSVASLRKLIEWIKGGNRQGLVTVRDVQNGGPELFRKPGLALGALRVLVAGGIGRWDEVDRVFLLAEPSATCDRLFPGF